MKRLILLTTALLSCSSLWACDEEKAYIHARPEKVSDDGVSAVYRLGGFTKEIGCNEWGVGPSEVNFKKFCQKTLRKGEWDEVRLVWVPVMGKASFIKGSVVLEEKEEIPNTTTGEQPLREIRCLVRR